MESYQRAMTYIQALSDAGEGFRYDLGLLNGLHFIFRSIIATNGQVASDRDRSMSPAPMIPPSRHIPGRITSWWPGS